MIEFLLMCGLAWIVLRILAAFVSIPFQLIGALLQGPSSIGFWIVLIGLIIFAYSRSDRSDRNSGAYRMRQLYRSETNRRICGVCGGIGDYFNVDPSIVRLLFVVLALLSGGCVVLGYLLAALIIPRESAL